MISSALAVLVLTLVFGVAYPLAATGIAQVIFPGKADGSRVERDGELVGSKLIAQDFKKPVLDRQGKPRTDADGNPVLEPDPRYFQSRPSATGYNPSVTFFNNLGPNNKDLSQLFRDNLDAYIALERPYNAGLTGVGRARGRGHHDGVGRRSPHLRGQRAHPGPPRCRRAPSSRSHGSSSWSTTTPTTVTWACSASRA